MHLSDPIRFSTIILSVTGQNFVEQMQYYHVLKLDAELDDHRAQQ